MNGKAMAIATTMTAMVVLTAWAGVETARGKVVSVDAEAPSITVVFEGRTEEATLAVNGSTKVAKDGRPATLAEVSSGDRVAVNYRKVDGGYLALAIVVVEIQAQTSS